MNIRIKRIILALATGLPTVAVIPCDLAAAPSFEVVEIGSEAAYVRTKSSCAPGSIVEFSNPASNDEELVWLTIMKERSPGLFEGKPTLGKLTSLAIGQKGQCDAPRYNYKKALVSLEPTTGDRRETLASLFESDFISGDIPKGLTPDFTIRLKENSNTNILTCDYTSPLWAVSVRDDGTADDVAKRTKELVAAESEAYYWMTLDNPFLPSQARGDIKPQGNTKAIFDCSGKAVVPNGHQLELVIAAGEVGGNFLLVELGHRGTMKLIVPPDGDADEILTYNTKGRRLPEVRTEKGITAENVTFIVIFSTVSRPLSAFLPRSLRPENLVITDSLGKELSLDSAGPGFSGKNKKEETLESLDPKTWDVARFHIQISGNTKTEEPQK